MARMNDRMNALPRANSLPHEDSHPLLVSHSLPGAPRKQLDHGNSAYDATTTADFRRPERPASEGALGHKPGSTGGNIDNNIAGGKVTNVLVTESINSSDGRGAKLHGAPRKGSPTKPAPSSDSAKAETPKENHTVSETTLNVPRGYFIVERVERHKIIEVRPASLSDFPLYYTSNLHLPIYRANSDFSSSGKDIQNPTILGSRLRASSKRLPHPIFYIMN
jgi:hypothetical protein